MKLVRFNGGRIGVLTGDTVHDVTNEAAVDPAAWPPTGMVKVISDFDRMKSRFAAALGSRGLPLAEVELEAPLLWPNKLLAYPVSYKSHGEETGSSNRIDKNGFFLICNSSLAGPSDPIILPDIPSREVHHECELAVIIGKAARHVRPKDALAHVFGYTCLVDVTLRGTGERVMRKSFDTFTPIGPALVTADEVANPDSLDIRLWVNDELRQHANTGEMILDIANQVSLAASVCTLYPGDIIATGTPGGVGRIKDGDRVTIEIEHVGRMTLPVKQGHGGSNVVFAQETR